MSLPFTPSGEELSDEEYAALDRYYQQPYYDRDPSELRRLREKYRPASVREDEEDGQHVPQEDK